VIGRRNNTSSHALADSAIYSLPVLYEARGRRFD
jgi:hypothetical protein